jgi:hypothetical protein
MNQFYTYLQLGMGHILNVAAIDHLLFILSFVIGIQSHEIKKALYWVSAFTFGHSITLALATFKIIQINPQWIEFLIPVTILISTISYLKQKEYSTIGLKFVFIAFFGLIHGLGFSNYLQTLLGKEQSILIPLIGFNLGVEIAQLIVVSFLMISLTTIEKFLSINRKYVNYAIILIIIGLVLPMIWERIP